MKSVFTYYNYVSKNLFLIYCTLDLHGQSLHCMCFIKKIPHLNKTHKIQTTINYMIKYRLHFTCSFVQLFEKLIYIGAKEELHFFVHIYSWLFVYIHKGPLGLHVINFFWFIGPMCLSYLHLVYTKSIVIFYRFFEDRQTAVLCFNMWPTLSIHPLCVASMWFRPPIQMSVLPSVHQSLLPLVPYLSDSSALLAEFVYGPPIVRTANGPACRIHFIHNNFPFGFWVNLSRPS